MGANLARQARRLGMHVNFAPSVDVNNNPNNPVINFRSFGENKYAVARKALAYMRGMQDNHLLTSLKHFPGHGDTGTDSHYDLPLIGKSRVQLDSLELYPFRQLIQGRCAGRHDCPSEHSGAGYNPQPPLNAFARYCYRTCSKMNWALGTGFFGRHEHERRNQVFPVGSGR